MIVFLFIAAIYFAVINYVSRDDTWVFNFAGWIIFAMVLAEEILK